jgi:hypothetical protein
MAPDSYYATAGKRPWKQKESAVIILQPLEAIKIGKIEKELGKE